MEIHRKHEEQLSEHKKTALNVNLAYSFEGLKEKLAKIDEI